MAKSTERRILEVKPSERVHPKTLMVATLTAVTLAVVSTRLTSLLNSLALVAVASLLTAFVSEFYRIIIEAIQRIIARQLELANARWQFLVNEDTEEIPPITDEVIEEIEHQEEIHKRKQMAARVAFPVIFTLVAFATVGASFFIGKLTSDETPQITKLTQVETIPKAKEREIIKESSRLASKRALENIDLKKQEAIEDANAYTHSTRDELLEAIADLERKLEAAEATKGDQKDEIRELRRTLSKLLDKQAKLEERLASLERAAPGSDSTAPSGDAQTP